MKRERWDKAADRGVVREGKKEKWERWNKDWMEERQKINNYKMEKAKPELDTWLDLIVYITFWRKFPITYIIDNGSHYHRRLLLLKLNGAGAFWMAAAGGQAFGRMGKSFFSGYGQVHNLMPSVRSIRVMSGCCPVGINMGRKRNKRYGEQRGVKQIADRGRENRMKGNPAE